MGTSPAERGSLSGQTCPDVIELDSGDFAVVGAKADLMTIVRIADIGVEYAEDEEVVIVPRDVMLAAARQIVDNNPDPRER